MAHITICFPTVITSTTPQQVSSGVFGSKLCYAATELRNYSPKALKVWQAHRPVLIFVI
jgi:hypothetical protein